MASKAIVLRNQLRTAIFEENLVKGQAVNSAAGSRTTFNVEWPTGPAIYETTLRLVIALTVGTASGPVTDGILNYIKQIYMKGDNNEVFVDNISARALVMGPAIIKAGTVPAFDQIAAASATYRVDIPIKHWDELTKRPEDLFVDSRRYHQMELAVTVGQMSDLFTTPGTASVVITADVDIVRSKDDLPDGLKAIGFTSYVSQNFIDPTTIAYMPLLRASDVYHKRLYLQTASATGFWTGPHSDVVLQNLRVTSSDDVFIKNTDWLMKKNRDKQFYGLEAAMTGRNVVDFVRDKSNKSALFSDRNNLRLEWDTVAGLAAGSYVSVLAEVYRKFKEAA
jgi:hypothetical protein